MSCKFWKKLQIALLLVVCSFVIGPRFSVNAAVYSGYFQKDTEIRWELDEQGTLTISGTGSTPDFPSFMDDADDTRPWKEWKNEIKKVVISEGIEELGGASFSWCKSLNEVVLPSSLKKIGAFSFFNCESLTELTIPSNVTSIDIAAFQGCSSLKSVVIPKGVTCIDGCVFNSCKSLREVTIPSGVTEIGLAAFQYCENLEEVVIPTGVTAIGENAFGECKKLVRVEIPSSVVNIGAYAFFNCESLLEVLIPADVTEIKEHTFYGCSSLKKVKNMVGVKIIGEEAFKYCNNLTEVLISNAVTSIGKGAFECCQAIQEINLPKGIKKINDYTFNMCESLTAITIPSGVTCIGESAFSACSSLAEIVIPDGVNEIGAYAFNGCKSISRICLPYTISQIGSEAFSLCNDIEKMLFEVYEGTYAESYVKQNEFRYNSLVFEITTPTNLSASGKVNSVTISWNAVPGASLYALYLKRTNGETVLVNSRLAETNCTINNLEAGTKVGFVVKAYGHGKWSGWSATVWATPTAPEVVTPTNLRATASNGTVSLTWDAVPGAQLYALFLKRTNGEVVLIDNRVTTNSYNLTNLANGTTLGFIVKAYGYRKWSGWSTTVWATPSQPVVAPSNVSATAENNTISVSWDAVPGAQVYALFLKRTNGEVVLIDNRVSSTSYTLNNMVVGNQYGFVVKAYIEKKWSGWSSTVWVTLPAKQTGLNSKIKLVENSFEDQTNSNATENDYDEILQVVNSNIMTDTDYFYIEYICFSKDNMLRMAESFAAEQGIKEVVITELIRCKNSSYYKLELKMAEGYQFIWAFQHKDTSKLSAEDLLAYQKMLELVDEAKQYDTEYEKELFFHNYLIANIVYTLDENWDTTGQSPYGALILKKCVCAGYAKTFNLLLRMSGIEVYYVTGTAKGENHAWSKAKIDGDWYNVDVTWDDPLPDVEGRMLWYYFNVTDEKLAEDHTWDNTGLPACTETKLNYYVKEHQ